jgi:hypothetical protein
MRWGEVLLGWALTSGRLISSTLGFKVFPEFFHKTQYGPGARFPECADGASLDICGNVRQVLGIFLPAFPRC